MFIACSAVLVSVSLATAAPERRTLAGLTFATVDEKLNVEEMGAIAPQRKPAAETRLERRVNLAFSVLLVAVVVGLWVYFR
jgi:hypothetical protein